MRDIETVESQFQLKFDMLLCDCFHFCVLYQFMRILNARVHHNLNCRELS